MSEYFSATAQASNARLSRSDEVVVCIAGFIVGEGRVNYYFLKGWKREFVYEIIKMSIKAVYFLACAF